MKPYDKPDLRGIWLYGPSGCGKSSSARLHFPDSYPKMLNKWWDGYQDQKSVIMDDVGPHQRCLGDHLKLWADRYGTILEAKGHALIDHFTDFIVTS